MQVNTRKLRGQLIRNFQKAEELAAMSEGKAAEQIDEIEAYFKERMKKVCDAAPAERESRADGAGCNP